MESHYMLVVGALQVIGGALLLIGRFVPLGFILLGPVIVNILLFHAFLMPEGIGPGLVVTALFLFCSGDIAKRSFHCSGRKNLRESRTSNQIVMAGVRRHLRLRRAIALPTTSRSQSVGRDSVEPDSLISIVRGTQVDRPVRPAELNSAEQTSRAKDQQVETPQTAADECTLVIHLSFRW